MYGLSGCYYIAMLSGECDQLGRWVGWGYVVVVVVVIVVLTAHALIVRDRAV